MANPDILIALSPVIKALESLSIQYYIGGSVASSIYGMARATMDVDIIADIEEIHVKKLKEFLEENYYIDEDMIKDAIKRKASFNLIHFETAFKIDIFIFNNESYQKSAIARKVKDKFSDEHEFEFYFSAPEDVVISKLQWYVQGNMISERQWLDILGVIKVQANNLDIRYLLTWSKKLNLFKLLKKAFQESGVSIQE